MTLTSLQEAQSSTVCDKNANTFVVKNMLPILFIKKKKSKRVMFYNVAQSKIANLLWYKWEILIFQS